MKRNYKLVRNERGMMEYHPIYESDISVEMGEYFKPEEECLHDFSRKDQCPFCGKIEEE